MATTFRASVFFFGGGGSSSFRFCKISIFGAIKGDGYCYASVAQHILCLLNVQFGCCLTDSLVQYITYSLSMLLNILLAYMSHFLWVFSHDFAEFGAKCGSIPYNKENATCCERVITEGMPEIEGLVRCNGSTPVLTSDHLICMGKVYQRSDSIDKACCARGNTNITGYLYC